MKKIISLFQRNYDGDRLVRKEVVPGAEWVTNGDGVATRKFDGTCCLISGCKLFKRYDVKKGRTPPNGFEPAQDPDPATGHWPGWVPVGGGPEDRWHREAMNSILFGAGLTKCISGTYELCGPMINGNPEGFENHVLIQHGLNFIHDAPRTFDALKEWFRGKDIEGIVWHHPDGMMVKIKGKDFGIKRIS